MGGGWRALPPPALSDRHALLHVGNTVTHWRARAGRTRGYPEGEELLTAADDEDDNANGDAPDGRTSAAPPCCRAGVRACRGGPRPRPKSAFPSGSALSSRQPWLPLPGLRCACGRHGLCKGVGDLAPPTLPTPASARRRHMRQRESACASVGVPGMPGHTGNTVIAHRCDLSGGVPPGQPGAQARTACLLSHAEATAPQRLR